MYNCAHTHSPRCNLAILSTREDAGWDSKPAQRTRECHHNHITKQSTVQSDTQNDWSTMTPMALTRRGSKPRSRNSGPALYPGLPPIFHTAHSPSIPPGVISKCSRMHVLVTSNSTSLFSVTRSKNCCVPLHLDV